MKHCQQQVRKRLLLALVYPGHDYRQRRVYTIMQERERNPRLGGAIASDQFLKIMSDLGLPFPKKLDVAVPANLKCGNCADDEEGKLKAIGGTTPQG